MPLICPRCSELLPDDAGFCPFDGAQLQKTSDRFLGKTIAARYRLLRHVWHPALFVFAVYIIVLSSMVLVTAR